MVYLICEGSETEIEILRLYVNSAINPEKIPEPCMTFLSEAGKTEEITWGFLVRMEILLEFQ